VDVNLFQLDWSIHLSLIEAAILCVRCAGQGGRAGAGPEVPAKPWMGFQNYGWVWHDNDFYQELWHQLAAGGVSQFYYFAPWIFGVTMREHELVSDMLSEMTALLGCADRSWITDTNIRWQDDFLLSGSTVGTGNLTQRVWRFTPLDPTSFAPVVSAKLSPREAGNVTIPVTMEMSGKQRACELSFVQAVLRFGRSSHYGWWITQPDAVPPVAVNCSSGGTALETTWPLPHGLGQ
jgi:hypothetical protein